MTFGEVVPHGFWNSAGFQLGVGRCLVPRDTRLVERPSLAFEEN